MSIKTLITKLEKELNLKTIELDESVEKLQEVMHNCDSYIEERVEAMTKVSKEFDELLVLFKFINDNADFAKEASKNYLAFQKAYIKKISK